MSVFPIPYVGVRRTRVADAVKNDNHMRNAIDLRKATRYRLSAPTLFMWASRDGRPKNGRGFTRDVNTSGVFIETDALPPVGARVQIEIVLPNLADSGPGMHLQGEGIVLRCACGGATQSGFAASAQFYPETIDVVLSRIKVFGQIV